MEAEAVVLEGRLYAESAAVEVESEARRKAEQHAETAHAETERLRVVAREKMAKLEARLEAERLEVIEEAKAEAGEAIRRAEAETATKAARAKAKRRVVVDEEEVSSFHDADDAPGIALDSAVHDGLGITPGYRMAAEEAAGVYSTPIQRAKAAAAERRRDKRSLPSTPAAPVDHW